MAVHNDLPPMAREAIEEYLTIANYCVTTRKPNNGVYGYPAVLLLFSVVDALSNYAGHPKNSFLAMKGVVPSLSDEQIKKLAAWYRHLPAHQAIILPGTAVRWITSPLVIDGWGGLFALWHLLALLVKCRPSTIELLQASIAACPRC